MLSIVFRLLYKLKACLSFFRRRQLKNVSRNVAGARNKVVAISSRPQTIKLGTVVSVPRLSVSGARLSIPSYRHGWRTAVVLRVNSKMQAVCRVDDNCAIVKKQVVDCRACA